MLISSWNINGLRSGQEVVLNYLRDAQPDILCLQETRLQPHQIDLALRHPQGYQSAWSHAAQAGYSGLAIYSRTAPKRISIGLGQERFDIEGRVLVAEFEDFSLLNVYVPSGAGSRAKWFYKMAFLYALMEYLNLLLESGQSVIVAGDFNIAHFEIDVARPIRVAGFMAEERDWMSELLDMGFVDSLRLLYPQQGGLYSWWSQRGDLRARNQGWRLDYLLLSADLAPRLQDAAVHPDILGSDHSPISLTF